MWYVLLSIAVIARCWDRPPTNNITNNTTTSSSPSAAAHRITYTTCIYKRSRHRNYVGRARSGCPTSLGAVTFDAWSRAIEPNIPYRRPDNDIPAFILIRSPELYMVVIEYLFRYMPRHPARYDLFGGVHAHLTQRAPHRSLYEYMAQYTRKAKRGTGLMIILFNQTRNAYLMI